MSAFDSKSYPYWLGTYSSGDSSSSVPIGSVQLWLTATAPTNWFLLQGQKLNINTYNSLYNIIGNTYSSGGGVPGGLFCSTYSVSAGTITFNLFATQVNFSLAVGDTFIATGFTASVGASVNGSSFVVLTAPAINATGGAFTATTTLTSGDNGISGNITRTNFSLPDVGGRTIRGVGTSTWTGNNGASGTTAVTLGQKAGYDGYKLLADNLPQHRHGVLVPGNGMSPLNANGGTPNVDNGTLTIAGTTKTDAGVLVTNSQFGMTNAYIGLNYIIKYA